MSTDSFVRGRRRASPSLAYALLVVGLLAFVAATVASTRELLASSFAAVTTGAPLLTGPTVVSSGGLMIISCASILLGLVLLTLRS